MNLELNYEKLESNIGLVRLAGRLDVPGVQEIDLKFTVHTSTQRLPVIVDLEKVTLIASMGLAMLITNAKSLKTHGIPFILLNPQPQVEKVIVLSGLEGFLPIERDLSSALQRIKNWR
jgi:anti-sigma B factor antagonist